jgi:hypothetical protein
LFSTRARNRPHRVCHNMTSLRKGTKYSKAVPELKRLVAGFPPRWPGFESRSGHVGFVVDKVALRQVFSEYFGFPCQFAFHRLLHNLSIGAGTIGQTVAAVPSGLSLTTRGKEKKYSNISFTAFRPRWLRPAVTNLTRTRDPGLSIFYGTAFLQEPV